MNITEKFISIIYEISQMNISDEVKKQAKKCFLDYIAVSVGGSAQSACKIDKYISDSSGEFSLWGLEKKVNINSAAIINATNAHILELDDGHRRGMLHLAAPIFSGLTVVAEKENCNVDDVLRGAVVGYEASIRIANAIQPYHKKQGFHGTGTCGTIGCALGIAAMLGYTKEEMTNVLSAAATSGAGLLEVITGSSEQKPYNVANAANAGINAAQFGKYFGGPKDILGGPRGFLSNFGSEYNSEALVEKTGTLKINEIYMKPYAACRHCHAPIEAALEIKKNNAIDNTRIEKIHVDTYGLAVYGHEHTDIEGVNSAKMSIPYSVAAALLYEQAGLEVFTEDKIQGEVLRLTQKVDVVENEELSKWVPEKRAAIVRITTDEGNEYTHKVEYPKGEPENPISEEELVVKLESLLGYAGFNSDKAKEIMNLVDSNSKIKVLYDVTGGK